MTRDEAIKICRAKGWALAHHFVDTLAELGVLRLDEPQSRDGRIYYAIWNCRELDGVAPTHVMRALDQAGLKIVEK